MPQKLKKSKRFNFDNKWPHCGKSREEFCSEIFLCCRRWVQALNIGLFDRNSANIENSSIITILITNLSMYCSTVFHFILFLWAQPHSWRYFYFHRNWLSITTCGSSLFDFCMLISKSQIKGKYWLTTHESFKNSKFITIHNFGTSFLLTVLYFN